MGPSRNIILIIPLTFFTLFFSLILSPTYAQKSPTNPQKPKPTNLNPYETVNNFCLHKRLNVNKPFCLKVLKTPKAANTKPDDLNPLLQVAINSTSTYICKILNQFLDLSEDLKTRPAWIPAIEKCISDYENIAEYITNVLLDASQESTIAGLDGEVIVEYINGCIYSLSKVKVDSDISAWNNEAKSYAKLLIDIADNLGSKEPK